ncbi:hypothetical protein [Candidatus Electrothrix sp.]|uniref:hypothetical protein n=1 Tax=Candidatus Electrothrix sp. TaxID=2170559 RepID=UPI0040576931
MSTASFCYNAGGGKNAPAAVQNDVYLLQDHFLLLQDHFLLLQDHFFPLQDHFLPLQNAFLPLQSRFFLLRNHFFPLQGHVLLSHEDFPLLTRSFALSATIFSSARRQRRRHRLFFSPFFDIGQ